MPKQRNKRRVGSNTNKIIGVYTLQGVKNQNAIKIRHLETGALGPDQRIKDTSIHKYKIANHIFGEIYACNITDTSLMMSKTQPLLYATLALVKPLRMAVLCNIVLKFTIEEEIKSKEQFLTQPLHGKFFLDVFKDGKTMPLDTEIDKFPGEEEMLKMIEEFTKTENMVNLLKEMAEIEEEKLTRKYREEFEYFSKIPKATVSLDDYLSDSDK